MTDTSTTVTRRGVFAGAGALAAAAAVGTAPARAGAPMLGASTPMVYRFMVGDYEVTTILDGAIQLDGPHPIFGQNTTQEEVAALAEANFLPGNRMEIGFTVTLVNTGAQLIMFDAGNGAGRRPNAGLLAERLAAAGYAPDMIDVIAMTHFHPDHIGGLAEEGFAIFENASLRLPSAEYDFWSPAEVAEAEATARVGKLVQSNVVPLVDDSAEMVKGGRRHRARHRGDRRPWPHAGSHRLSH